MRVKSRRFPTIEKDMKMVLAHCGSLFLDPGTLMQVSPSCMHCTKGSCGDNTLRISAALPLMRVLLT